MGYKSLSLIAQEFVSELKALDVFKYVTYSQATNGSQIYSELESMANLKSAIVVIGDVNYSDDSCKRVFNVMIFITMPFVRGVSSKADGIWDILEKVCNLFVPVPTSNAGLLYREILDLEFMLKSTTPIESDENISACVMTLECTEFL